MIEFMKVNDNKTFLGKLANPKLLASTALFTVGGVFFGGTETGLDLSKTTANKVGQILAAPEDYGQAYRSIEETKMLDEIIDQDHQALVNESISADYDDALQNKEFFDWLNSIDLNYTLPATKEEFMREEGNKFAMKSLAENSNKVSYYALQQLQMLESNLLELVPGSLRDSSSYDDFMKFLKDNISKYPFATKELDYRKPLLKQIYTKFTPEEKKLPIKEKIKKYQSEITSADKAIRDYELQLSEAKIQKLVGVSK